MRKRRPREETRAIVLEEAHRVVREEGLPEGIAYRLNDSLSALGLTTGAAYNIWDSQDDFRVDLSVRVAETVDWVSLDAVRERLDQLPTDLDCEEYCHQLGQLYFQHFSQRPEFFLGLYFGSVDAPSEELAAALRQGQVAIGDAVRGMVDRVFERYGAKFHDPADLSTVIDAVVAALQGLALQPGPTSPANVNDGSLFGNFFASMMANVSDCASTVG